MTATVEFCLARAAESTKAAEDTGLIQVRHFHERSAAAWQTMADRIRHFEDRKLEQARLKAEREEGAG